MTLKLLMTGAFGFSIMGSMRDCCANSVLSAAISRMRMVIVEAEAGEVGFTTPLPTDGTNGFCRGSSILALRLSSYTCSNTKLAVFGRFSTTHETRTRAVPSIKAGVVTARASVVNDLMTGAPGTTLVMPTEIVCWAKVVLDARSITRSCKVILVAFASVGVVGATTPKPLEGIIGF